MYSVSKLIDLVHRNHLDGVVKNNMCSISELKDLIHQNHLDDTVKKISKTRKMSLSIELEEDLSQEDLKYIKKGVEAWYERYL